MDITESDLFKKILSCAIDNGEKPNFDIFETCEIHGQWQYMKDIDNDPNKTICINASCPDCIVENKVKKIMGDSGIQKRFLKCTFENYHTDNENSLAIKNRLIGYCNKFKTILENGNNLILSGSVGTGKTHLSCAVANEIAKKGFTSVFRTLSEISSMIHNAKSFDAEKNVEQVMKSLVEVDLLIIDEVGAVAEKDNAVLFDVINARYAENRPMIILTNLDSDNLQREIGARSFDRLAHSGVYLTMAWNSYRRKKNVEF